MDASNTCSCDNKRAQIESGPGGASTPFVQGLTATEERLMIEFNPPAMVPGRAPSNSPRVDLDRWAGNDKYPFGDAQ